MACCRIKMKFEILEKQEKDKCFEISLSKDSLKTLKKEFADYEKFSINADDLNIFTCLYSNTKKESIEIQKKNCKQMLKFFKVCVKAVKLLKKHNKFTGTFYVFGLNSKKNNNDFMLASMLDVKFNVNPFNRLSKAIDYSCDFIDAENTINNMCDFKDNKCICHREKGKKGTTGCCPSFCKYTKEGICKHKSLSCKIFMCDYLEEKGRYFTPHTIPLLKQHLTIFERFICFGLLFKTHKQTVKRIWGIRTLEILYLLLVVGVVVLICL